MEFKPFPKVSRLYRQITITEKIDGTNSCIYIGENTFFTQSRNRVITPEDDNFGFSAWAYSNQDLLTKVLGPGYHYGEWWGKDIQRGYNLNEKTFSLFNTKRWLEKDLSSVKGLSIVPILYEGPFDDAVISQTITNLMMNGSRAKEGYLNPEGIIIYHEDSNSLFKFTLKGDGHKGIKK